jgi:hypothetical protein
MATGLVAYDNINGEKASKGSSATNRIAGTVYATSLDLSSTITVGTSILSSSRLDPGASGTFDIGTTTKPGAGINGNDIAVTSQPGSDYSGGLGPGLGGDSTLKGGTGGLGDAIIVPSANGGDAYVEGGPAGANLGGGVGVAGKVNIGLSDTSAIIIGSIHMLWNVDGGGNIGYDGSNNKRPDIIRAKTKVSAGDTITMKGDRFSVAGAGSDPGTLVAGDLWYRTDLGRFKFRNASTAVELLDSSSAITNPTTKAQNDILQYNGSSWDAVGAATGDRIQGTLHFYTNGAAIKIDGGLYFDGSAPSTNIIGWMTDGGGYIGQAGTFRPDTIYAKTAMYAAGQLMMKAGDSTGGDLSGTYPSTLTVTKVQGYSMTSGAPVKGDFWQFDGTNWIHARNNYRVLAIGSANISGAFATVASYTPIANEFSANTIIKMICEVYNPSGLGVDTEMNYNGGSVNINGTTDNHNFYEYYGWEEPTRNSYIEYSAHHRSGVANGDYSTGTANFITTTGTWYARARIYSGSGTAYVRAYIIAIHKE